MERSMVMRFFSSFVLAMSTLAILGSPTLAQDKPRKPESGREERQRLFIRLRNNQEYNYQVTLGSDATDQRSRDERRGGGGGAEADREKEKSGGMETADFNYRVRVTDTSGGENTLEVTVDRSSGAGRERSGTNPRTSLAPEPREGSQKFTVKVGQDGEVKTITADTSPGRGPQPSGQSLGERDLKHHLEVILGSGFHRNDLEPKKVYSLTSRKEGEESSTGGGRSEERRGSREKEREKERENERSPRNEQSAGTGLQPPLDATTDILKWMHARFDSFSGGEKGQTARFTLMVPQFGMETGERAEERQRKRQDESRPGFPLDEKEQEALKLKSVGEATYLAEDGLLEKMSAEGQLTSRDKDARSGPVNFRIRMQRLESSNRSSEK